LIERDEKDRPRTLHRGRRRRALESESVVACDHITTVRADTPGRQIGRLLDAQERVFGDAVRAAFDLG